ncbi:hypothetical protein [Radiobacillus sp. PE A8.2]|uniref:hypothetical protein n=1 Tax=Radiobacillus sp. PE A8.2 TaxID=3380349 RepID=UPI00388F0533
MNVRKISFIFLMFTMIFTTLPVGSIIATDTVSANTGKLSSGDTYYISPDGEDSNEGQTRVQPWKTFDHAIPNLQPGDTLVMLDGTYTEDTTGYFRADCSIDSGFASSLDGDNETPGDQAESWRDRLAGAQAVNGTEEEAITITADNERQAYVQGDGSITPFMIYRCANWDVNGIHVSSADNPDGEDGDVFKVQEVNNVNLRRLIVHHNNRHLNSSLIAVNTSDNVLVEESELYYFHRNGLSAYQSDHVIMRRNYINSRGFSDIAGGYGSHAISRDGGDASAVFYYTANSTIENTISENKNESFSLGISGFRTASGENSGRHNSLYGSISMNDNRSGSFSQSRERLNNSDPEAGKPVIDQYVENFLVLNAAKRGISVRAGKELQFNNMTLYNVQEYEGNGAFHINGDYQKVGNTIWPSCDDINGCDHDIKNSLFLDNPGAVITTSGTEDWNVQHSNFWNNGSIGTEEAIEDDSGNIQHSQQVEPKGMGLEAGQCLVYIPEDSNMSGAGEDGADIGANILYRYQDGELTDEPLWDPVTGQFPHGAIVEGLNDIPGQSAFDVNERLNVNYNGCTLPYNKTELNETLTNAKELIATADVGEEVGQHPQSAVDTLEAAIANAEALIADGSVTEASFGVAVTTLNEAIEAFNNTVNELQTDGLMDAIAAATNLVKETVAGDEPGDYPQAAIDALQAVIADAEAVMTDDDAGQAQVDAAIAALNQAVATFEEAVIPEPMLTGVVVNQDDVLLEVDEAFDLAVEAIFKDESSSDVTAEASYSSSDEGVVKVTNEGGVKAVGVGYAQITIIYEGEITSIAVKVYSTRIEIGDPTEVIPGKVFTIEGSSASIKMPEDLPTGTTVTVVEAIDIEHPGYEVAGDVYTVEFTYPNGTSVQGRFTLTLGYDADIYEADEVFIFYYNEEAEAWEKQGGVVTGGVITLDVPHFSTYGVFAEVDNKETEEKPSKDDDGADPSGDYGDKLPDTAAFTYNWMLAGMIFLALGLIFILIFKKTSLFANSRE